MKEDSLVTVYIPTHNRRILLERTLISVVNQTYKNLEIIVVDDGSKDDTESFMQEFMQEYLNVKYLKHDTPKGANVARNYALRESKGHFVTGMDDDDEMAPTRVEELVNVYDDRYAYVFSLYKNIFEDGREAEVWGTKKEIINLDDMLYRNVTGNQVLTTREMFFKADLFDEELVAAQDYDMWIRMLKIKPTAKAIMRPLYNMHIHTYSHGRISDSNKRSKGYFQCYRKHKSIMTRKHIRYNLRRFRDYNGKEIRNIKNRNLYEFMEWPRLLAAHIKRKILK